MEQIYDLGLAWNWEYDADFIFGIERECRNFGFTTFRVEPHNVKEVTRKFHAGKIFFRTFLDRASDEDETFFALARLLAKSKTHLFNRYDRVEYAKDKANLHLACLGENIDVPYTIIISPYNKKKEIELSLSELAHLGRPFIIKPANTTGGGIGVILGAESLKDVLQSRQHHKNDKYLLQEKVQPKQIDGKVAWFRVFYAFGRIVPCWWNHETHLYTEMTEEKEKEMNLGKLRDIAEILQSISKLDFFSTEIALTQQNKFVAVDYINEICDMRPQFHFVDGIPGAIILLVQKQLAKQVKLICEKMP